MIDTFFNELSEVLSSDKFVGMTVSKPLKSGDELRNVYVKSVVIKGNKFFSFTFRYLKRDETKNFDAAQTMEQTKMLLSERFLNAALFTTEEDVSLLVSKKGKATVIRRPVKEQRSQNTRHDHLKNRLIDVANPWWFKLGLTTREGDVLAEMQHKYKQICKYVEIVAGLLKPLKINSGRKIRIADMGAGKGYLTFALYEYLTSNNIDVEIEGVEIRPDLVQKINNIIKESAIHGFRFVENSIADYVAENLDVMIALHACNTATDDAISKGIENDAELLICAPCCHKQIRIEMEKSGVTDCITRYGILLERQAAMVTDAVRALVMEYFGYKTQIMEFIEMEHTPKNILVVGTKDKNVRPKSVILAEIRDILARYGISHHYLVDKMKMNLY